MYCSACGTEATGGVVYCPRCGEKLGPTQALVSTPAPEKLSSIVNVLVAASTIVGVAGLAVATKIILTLVRLGVDISAVVVIALLVFSSAFGIIYLLTGQLAKVINAYLNSGNIAPAPAQLKAPQPAQLEPARQPVSSIVEQTTRNLAALPRETRG